MSAPSESDIPAAFPKSRCAPSNTPPPSWVTSVSQQLPAPANQQDRSPSLEITGQFGHYRLQGTTPHEAQSFLQAILQTENNAMCTISTENSMFGLWSSFNQHMMNAEFLRRVGALPSAVTVGALPSVSNEDVSGSADQNMIFCTMWIGRI